MHQSSMKKRRWTCWLRTVAWLCIWSIALARNDDDDDVKRQFQELLKTETHLAVLFTKPCCDCAECVEAETLLGAVSPEIENSFGIRLVKLIDRRDFEDEYGVTALPSMVFIRNGVPASYDGVFERNAVMEWLGENGEPSLKDLDDDVFEHLTQAATGATTGDWLVAFYGSGCARPQGLQAILEGASTRLRSKLNVARVNVDVSPRLAERFRIVRCPTIYFFRLGKMYAYNLPKVDVASLRSFAEGWYKHSKGLLVPLPPSPFDELTEGIARKLKENQTVVIAAGVVAVLFLCMACTCMRRPDKKTRKKD